MTRREALLAAPLLIALTAGCATHAQHRAAAELRWNQVRARVKHQLASQQFERGQIDAAVETVNEAISLDDSSAEQFLLLAHCRLEQGRLASARKAVAAAQWCDPQSSEVEYTLGVMAERADQPEAALGHYHRARLGDDSVVDYVVAEAECLSALGRPEEALTLIAENIDGFDREGTLESLSAQICLLIGDKVEAVRHYRLALEQSGCGWAVLEGPGACDNLVAEYGRLLSETGRYVEAAAVLGPYVEARRDLPPSVVTALCTAYLATDRIDEARDLLREELRRRGEKAFTAADWMLLARASIITEDWMTARRCTDWLTNLAPDHAPTHLLRGFVCWKQDDLEAAKESLDRVLSLDPADALAHCLLGRMSADSGDRAAAEDHYRRALQIDPRCAWARQLLSNADSASWIAGSPQTALVDDRGGPLR